MQTKSTSQGLEFLPDAIANPFRGDAAPIGGFLTLLSGILDFGWRPTLVVLPGLLICLFGKSFGISAVGPIPAWGLSAIIGGLVILIGDGFCESETVIGDSWKGFLSPRSSISSDFHFRTKAEGRCTWSSAWTRETAPGLGSEVCQLLKWTTGG